MSKKIRLDANYLCEVTLKLLTILEQVHARGVIHRDLKPQNIMLLMDHLFLIDFGISEVVAPTMIKKRTFVGTHVVTQEPPGMPAWPRTRGYRSCPVMKSSL